MSRFGSRSRIASYSARLRPNSVAIPRRSVSQRARSAGSRRTYNIISLVGSVLSQRSTLPIGHAPQDLRIRLDEHDDAALVPAIAHVVGDVARELHDGPAGHHDLLARDVHVRGALEHEDRFFLPGVRVHDGGLSRLVAGDLGPELV